MTRCRPQCNVQGNLRLWNRGLLPRSSRDSANPLQQDLGQESWQDRRSRILRDGDGEKPHRVRLFMRAVGAELGGCAVNYLRHNFLFLR